MCEVDKVIEASEGRLKEIILKNTGRRKKKTPFENTYVGYSITFVYSKYHGNFIVKGYTNDVKDYLKVNYTHYFYNQSIYLNGKQRFNNWDFWKEDVGLLRFANGEKMYGKYHIYNRKTKIEYTFKRMPNRWLPKFNKL